MAGAAAARQHGVVLAAALRAEVPVPRLLEVERSVGLDHCTGEDATVLAGHLEGVVGARDAVRGEVRLHVGLGRDDGLVVGLGVLLEPVDGDHWGDVLELAAESRDLARAAVPHEAVRRAAAAVGGLRVLVEAHETEAGDEVGHEDRPEVGGLLGRRDVVFEARALERGHGVHQLALRQAVDDLEVGRVLAEAGVGADHVGFEADSHDALDRVVVDVQLLPEDLVEEGEHVRLYLQEAPAIEDHELAVVRHEQLVDGEEAIADGLADDDALIRTDSAAVVGADLGVGAGRVDRHAVEGVVECHDGVGVGLVENAHGHLAVALVVAIEAVGVSERGEDDRGGTEIADHG